METLRKRKIIGVQDVAALWNVDPKTVARWANAGKVPHFRTPGGHRRFYEDEILSLVASHVEEN
jgi:excisionase family DNA binding protein